MQYLTEECNSYLAQMKGVMVVHCPREANQLADWITKAHHKGTLPPNWFSKPPQALWNMLCLETHRLCSTSFPI